MATIADLITDRADDPSTALLFEDAAWSYAELARQAAARASLLSAGPGADRLHVGVLLGNVPEFVFWLAAAALSRSVVVGINSTRRGAELADDIRTTDCRWLVTDSEHQDLLAGLDLPIAAEQTLIVDSGSYAERLGEHLGASIDAQAGVQLRPGSAADTQALDAHLRKQPELGTKWLPRFLRITSSMPTTATGKILKRQLRAERWECQDPVWWRPLPAADLRPLTAADLAAIREEFGRHGRTRALTLLV